MKIPTLRDEWISLVEAIFCGLESNTQYVDMQKAFYAGALSTLNIMVVAGKKDISEEDVLIVDSIKNEIIEFSKTIG